ncbi:hypothetical protein B7P43_G11863 [Cryptotermes secundus]|uniref:Uncharacterized protein n=1 Tax=Cryptotermes secundus TaxID=105785 RepID=A0A2J7QKQ8_9NEOP|nr:hypothetical protein B7P43_G11863 [Cryptotermes secundus]
MLKNNALGTNWESGSRTTPIPKFCFRWMEVSDQIHALTALLSPLDMRLGDSRVGLDVVVRDSSAPVKD